MCLPFPHGEAANTAPFWTERKGARSAPSRDILHTFAPAAVWNITLPLGSQATLAIGSPEVICRAFALRPPGTMYTLAAVVVSSATRLPPSLVVSRQQMA